jgi:hypothetical protein
VTVHSKSEGNYLSVEITCAGVSSSLTFSPLSLPVLPDDSSPYGAEEKFLETWSFDVINS